MDKAKENRKRFPQTAEWVDKTKELFGPGVKVVALEESGQRAGEIPPEWEEDDDGGE